MAILKCKMCGGNLEVTDDIKIVECDYCGTSQTIPKLDNERKVNLFNRATKLRMASEFDKAAGIYENIIADFPDEAEAYWGICLCNYGIEYVDDPATAKKIPTCHRASFVSLQKDENFGLALINADVIARELYIEEAKEIDRIMGGILFVSKNEKPYDVFICYKETDENGERTVDSVLAEELYDAITAKGLKVFFSKVTLDKKLGIQYEPYIFAALNSAKIMLVVGTKPEHFEAVWVKNEWSRFLRLMANDKSKLIIPCFKDIAPGYDLPEELRRLQAYDLGKLGVIQDLARGIEKIVGPKEEKTFAVSDFESKADALLKRTFLSIEYGEWDSAKKSCEEALNADAENGRAHLASLLIRLKSKNIEGLMNSETPLDTYNEYAKIMRFGDEKLKEHISAINEEINSRVIAENKEKVYHLAKIEMKHATTYKKFYEVAGNFYRISGFLDADELKAKCAEEGNRLREEEIKLSDRELLRCRNSLNSTMKERQKILNDLAKLNEERDSLVKKDKSFLGKMIGLGIIGFIFLFVIFVVLMLVVNVEETTVAVAFTMVFIVGYVFYKITSLKNRGKLRKIESEISVIGMPLENMNNEVERFSNAVKNWADRLEKAKAAKPPYES